MTAQSNPEKKNQPAHLANFSGTRGKKIRAERIAKILRHLFWFHCLNDDVIQHLIGSTRGNTTTLLAAMQKQRLIQKVSAEFTKATPKGYLWMLMEDGVVETTGSRDWMEPPHPYNTNPSPRLTQLGHDMFLAKLAAALLVRGVRIVGTDFSLRTTHNQGTKIADLVVASNGQNKVFEYERTLKNERDTCLALERSIRQKLPVMIICAIPYITTHWQKLMSEPEFGRWEKNATSGRWEKTGTWNITDAIRQRILVVDESQLDGWLDRIFQPPPQQLKRTTPPLTDEERRVLGFDTDGLDGLLAKI
jgi:hypothetical protein